MPRLYVGGLNHSVTQKDLTDRFGKFGNVEDVELRTRRDAEGVPYKTFAYINLNSSDSDLKKCMTVLNKSKWKGGTLQIELAKESLLHKFAQERQLQKQRPRQDADVKHQNSHKLLESLSKAGVDNFIMKAAVPGTEIPGHKDWVVSKFGRVLPVLQLRCQKGTKARTVKYDPSKYCHNIRRLAPPTTAADPPTPVVQLTWQIDGGDDDISKKRRGEFPPYQPPKKTRTDAVQTIKAGNNTRPAQLDVTPKPENHHLSNGLHPAQRRGRGSYEDSDSEEEIRRLVALEQASRSALWHDSQEGNLEVVGDNYLIKPGGSWQKDGGGWMNTEDEDDCDSADTDELFASRKRPLLPREDTSGGRTTGKQKRKREEQDGGAKKSAVLSKEAEEEFSIAKKLLFSPQEKNEKERMKKVKRRKEEQGQRKKKTAVLSKEEDNNDVEEICTSRRTLLPSHEKGGEEERTGKAKKRKEEQGQRKKKRAVLSKEEDNNDVEEICTSKRTLLPSHEKEGEEERTVKAKKRKEEQGQKKKQTAVHSEEEDNNDVEEICTSRKPLLPSHEKKGEREEGTGKVKRKKVEPDKKTTKSVVFSKKDKEEAAIDVEKICTSTKPSLPSQEKDDEEKALILREEQDKKTKKTTVVSKKEDIIDVRETCTSRKPSLPSQEKKKEKTENGKRKKEERGKRTKKTAVPSNKEEEEISTSRKFPARTNVSEETTGKAEKYRQEDDKKAKDTTAFPEKCAEVDSSKRRLTNERHYTLKEPAPRDPQILLECVSEEETLPEDILASLLGPDTKKDKKEEKIERRRNLARRHLLPFRGTATLYKDAVQLTATPEDKKAPSDVPSSSSVAVVTPGPRLSAREEAKQQRQDNRRRLAAVQQKLKEAEEHKKLIQGALANVDALTPRSGKHIIFDSDDDDETTSVAASEASQLRGKQPEDDEAAANESVPTKDEERARASGPRLFGSSEDEEDADDEEEGGGGRFNIKPQFEGQAGQKLMELQARFGTDERFRMDSRFLEGEDAKEDSDDRAKNKESMAADEDLLQEEKRRNMSILQSLLGPQAISRMTSAKAKTFRDASALHYDPSRADHAAFETKADGDKDTKSARRKKREAARRLPEVSKEIFYDVSGDLKAMFAPAAERRTVDRPATSWDQEDEEEDEKEEEQPAPAEHSGFMFSFFGDQDRTASEHTEYKAESVRGAKVSPWQLDPRLQDSSEEEEDEEEVQEEEGKEAPPNSSEEIVSSANNFFFFHLDDSRLTEGPKWFCRPSRLEREREEWEERTTELRQEYRKKHKDARRSLKFWQKT